MVYTHGPNNKTIILYSIFFISNNLKYSNRVRCKEKAISSSNEYALKMLKNTPKRYTYHYSTQC